MHKLIALVALIALSGCEEPPPASPINNSASAAAAAPLPTPQFDPALLKAARIAIRAEPRVRDFTLDPARTVALQVAVDDDGTRRYGLAEYFCMKLHELGVSSDETAVRIVDAAKVAQSNGDFGSISLGTVSCKDQRRWD